MAQHLWPFAALRLPEPPKPLRHRMRTRNLRDIPTDFRDISQAIGADGLLIQGAGGNTSIKIDEQLMWVKASGKWLQHAGVEDVFVAVDWSRVNENILNEADDPVQDASLETGSRNLRPSIETTLHSLMPHKVVFHTHSINTIVHAVQSQTEEALRPKLDGMKWGLVPYSKPGLALTRLVAGVLAARDCDVLIIQNHGLVVGGDSPAHALERMQEVETRLSVEPLPMLPAMPDPLVAACTNTGFMIAETDVIHQLALYDEVYDLARTGSLYPDHVVFLGSGIAGVESVEEMTVFCRSEAVDPLRPKAVALKGGGVAYDKSLSSGGIEMLTALAQVARRRTGLADVRYLSEAEERELVDWDAEKYRRTLED